MSYNFEEVVNESVKKGDLSIAIDCLEAHTSDVMKDSKNIERLINRAVTYDKFDEIQRIFKILMKNSFMFDSIDYTQGLKILINDKRVEYVAEIMTNFIEKGNSNDISSIQKVIMQMINQEHYKEASNLILKLQSMKYQPSTDFLLKSLGYFKEKDYFEEYRSVVHNCSDSMEIWGYYIEYCVETQRIREVLDSLEYYKTKSVIGSNLISLYNKLASDQIRFTIFKNQQDLPDDELEQIMKNFEDGDVSIKDSVLDRYGKLCKNYEEVESRFVNGIEIFSQTLYMNVGECKYDAAQIYLRSLLKYHHDVINDSSTIISFEDIMDFEDIKPLVEVKETAKRLVDSDDEEEKVNDEKEYEFV